MANTYRIRNRLNQPITVDPETGTRTLHFGPQEVKHNITKEEYDSIQMQAHLSRKNLIIVGEKIIEKRSET